MIKKLAIYLFILIFPLSGCGKNIFKRADVKDTPVNVNERVKKNIEEGRGIRFGKSRGQGGTFDFATSNELWRASLDTLDFMPLISADYGGGIIITDWYNQNNNYDDAIKISIRFLTNEIRSDALNVKVYTKKCENLNKCSINENNPEIQNKLISTILSKASKYKEDKKKKSRKIN